MVVKGCLRSSCIGFVSSPIRHIACLIRFYCENVVIVFGAARLEAISQIVFCFEAQVVVSPGALVDCLSSALKLEISSPSSVYDRSDAKASRSTTDGVCLFIEKVLIFAVLGDTAPCPGTFLSVDERFFCFCALAFCPDRCLFRSFIACQRSLQVVPLACRPELKQNPPAWLSYMCTLCFRTVEHTGKVCKLLACWPAFAKDNRIWARITGYGSMKDPKRKTEPRPIFMSVSPPSFHPSN